MVTRLPPLDTARVRELAVKAQVDPNTIRRVARKEGVRGMAGRRALAVLIAEGYLPPQEVLTLDGGSVGDVPLVRGGR